MRKVLYHKDCMDGQASAYVAYKKFGLEDTKYIPCTHGIPKEDIIEPGDEVYILDMYFPRELLLDWYDMAESITLLDHHETSDKLIGDLHFAHIDKNECGATLSWNYFFPNEEMPFFLMYVRDRDLWLWELEYSKAINSYIYLYSPSDYDAGTKKYFNSWKEIERMTDEATARVVDVGMEIEKFKDKLIDQAIDNAEFIDIGGYDVPVVYSGLLQSEIANDILRRDEEGDFPFAAVAVPHEDRMRYSLRSTDDRVDVSKIAEQYGGGGHRNAAGFRY